VTIAFLGARAGARPVPGRRLAGRVTYVWPGHTIAGLPTFAEVSYPELWPGIALRYHGSGPQLEFDFDLAPGASAGRIALAVRGARSLAIERATGALRLGLATGQLEQMRPVAYQQWGGRRHRVACRYLVRGGRIRLVLGRYDRARALVVDPRLVYSTYLGGTADDPVAAIAVDRAGNAYLTGTASGPEFPTTRGVYDRSAPATGSAFVTELNRAGRGLVYSTFLVGSSLIPEGIAVDRAGAAYLTGTVTAGDLPSTPGALQPALAGSANAFVLKLNPSGSGVEYATYLGGSGSDGGHSIAVDPSGDAFVTGSTTSPDFPLERAEQTTYGGGAELGDAFLTELNPSGTALLYSTFLGGSGEDSGSAVALSGDDAVVVGNTASADFPVRSAAMTCRSPSCGTGTFFAFAARIDPRLSGPDSLIYSTYLGGASGADAGAVATDRAGNAYVGGATGSAGYVAKLAPGGALLYTRSTGRNTVDVGGLAMAGSGLLAVAGSATFPGGRPPRGATVILPSASVGLGDTLVYVYGVRAVDGSVGPLLFLGGVANFVDGSARVSGLATGPGGDAYVDVLPASTDFPTTAHAYERAQRATGTGENAVVLRVALGARASHRPHPHSRHR
jgi:hypothetical protein